MGDKITTPPAQTPEETAKVNAIVAGVMQYLSGGNKNQAGSTTSKTITKIGLAAAKTLLAASYRESGYLGAITDADVKAFADKFNAETSKQYDEVVRATADNVTPGASATDISKTVSNILTTQYPSYFDANQYAKDFAWSKINFKDSATAGGKALDALTKARQIVDDSGADTLSEAETQKYAKQIGMGTLTEDGFKAILNNKYAILSYPQFAERLRDTPGITVKDLAQPYINKMAKELELDPGSIELNNQHLQKALRPDGTAGKAPSMSLSDFQTYLRNTKEWEKTSAANDAARSAATALGRAFGYGV